MKNIMILVLVLAGGYVAWQNYVKDTGLEPLYDESYVVVYGVERCPVCKKLRHQLDGTDLEYEWVDLDLTENGWEDFGIRADKAGLPRGGRVPFVEINGEMFHRPDFDTIIEIYNQGEDLEDEVEI